MSLPLTTRWGKSLEESLGRPLKPEDVLAAETYMRWEQDLGRRISAFDTSKLEKASQLLDTLHVAFECGDACGDEVSCRARLATPPWYPLGIPRRSTPCT